MRKEVHEGTGLGDSLLPPDRISTTQCGADRSRIGRVSTTQRGADRSRTDRVSTTQCGADRSRTDRVSTTQCAVDRVSNGTDFHGATRGRRGLEPERISTTQRGADRVLNRLGFTMQRGADRSRTDRVSTTQYRVDQSRTRTDFHDATWGRPGLEPERISTMQRASDRVSNSIGFPRRNARPTGSRTRSAARRLSLCRP